MFPTTHEDAIDVACQILTVFALEGGSRLPLWKAVGPDCSLGIKHVGSLFTQVLEYFKVPCDQQVAFRNASI